MWDIRGKLPFFKKRSIGKDGKVRTQASGPDDALNPAVLAKKAYSYIEKLSMIGDRPAASKASRRAANNISSIFEGFADSVRMVQVGIDPLLGTFWTKIIPLLMILSSFLVFLGLGYVSFILSALSGFELFLELVKGRSLLSRFMSRSVGQNVEAVIEAGEDAGRTVIFSSHLDSARLENRTEDKLPLGLTAASITYNLFISFAFCAGELSRGVLLKPNIPSFLPFLAVIPSAFLSVMALVKAWNFYSSSYSPGCGDNLSGVGVSLALCEYFSRNKPSSVRLVFVSFDGEECCRQGSLAYYAENRFEGKVENINFDGLYRSGDLAIISGEAVDSGFVDDSLASVIGETAKAMGYPVKVGRLDMFSGATDASSARKYGIPAATITCMAPGVETPAHSKGDVLQAIETDTLEKALGIAIKYVNSIDAEESRQETSARQDSLLSGRKYKISEIE